MTPRTKPWLVVLCADGRPHMAMLHAVCLVFPPGEKGRVNAHAYARSTDRQLTCGPHEVVEVLSAREAHRRRQIMRARWRAEMTKDIGARRRLYDSQRP